MRLLVLFFLSATLLAHASDKLIVEDFSDFGTWRSSGKNTKPEHWFAYGNCLSGGFADNSRDDGYAGKILYDFLPRGGELRFSRVKVSRGLMDSLDGVDFYLLSKNKCSFSFVIKDAKGKTFESKWTEFPASDSWTGCEVEFNKSSVKDFDKIVWPVNLFTMKFKTDSESGEINIDDISLSGKVAERSALAITPLLKELDTKPDTPFILEYRVANALDENIKGLLSLTVRNFEGDEVFKTQKDVDVAACKRSVVSFNIPALSIGAYSADLEFSTGRNEASYLDWLAVFVPNNRRINSKKMWFGISDTNCWNGRAETELHLAWLKKLGADIMRITISGGRLEPNDDPAAFAGAASRFQPYQDNGMLMCLTYVNQIPNKLKTEKLLKSDTRNGFHRLSDKPEEFKTHIARLFSNLKKYPNIRYIEWWSEPDIGNLDATTIEYLDSLKTVYETGKSIAPEILICTGGSCVIHPREKPGFSKDVYQKGAPYYDVADFHAHGPFSNYVLRQEKIESWLKDAGIDKPVSTTETGERSGYSEDSVKAQTATLVKKLTYARSRNTEFFLWFILQDFWDMDFGADDSFGLVTSDNRPKPFFPAYVELIKRLANTERGKKIEIGSGIDAYYFLNREDNSETLVCWPSLPGMKSSITFKGEGAIKVFDMFGAERKLESSSGYIVVTLNGNPCYIVYPAGRFSPAVPMVTQEGIAAAYAGGSVCVKIRISNPFTEDATFTIDVNDSPPFFAKLEHGKASVAEVNIKVPKRAKDLFMEKARIRIAHGENSFVQEIPLCVNVCYPVTDDSKSAAVISLNDLLVVKELAFDPQIPPWAGTNDLSAKFSAWREGEILKVLINVVDDKHVPQNQNSASAWRGDCIQLGFASVSDAGTLLTISDNGKHCSVWRHISMNKSGEGLWSVKSAFRREGMHSIYELSIPLREIGVQAQPGSSFRFAFQVNENDGTGLVRWLEYGGGIVGGFNPARFKWAVLK